MEIILLPLAEVRLDSQYLFIDFNVYYLTYLLSLLRVCNFFNAMMKNLFGDSHSSLQVSRACLASSDAIRARLNGPSLAKMLNSTNKKKSFALFVFYLDTTTWAFSKRCVFDSFLRWRHFFQGLNDYKCLGKKDNVCAFHGQQHKIFNLG